MYFETTTCVSHNHLHCIARLADQYDMSIRSFIVYMIIYAAKKEKASSKAFKSISYRDRKKDNPWKRVHLYLQYGEYEYLLDVKKVWKMSVAKVIEFCMENVLDEFLAFLNEIDQEVKRGNTDNYLRYEINRSYMFDFCIDEGVHCCRFYWGLPKKYTNQTQ